MDMSVSELREVVKDREAWNAAVHGVTESWTQLGNWTTTFLFYRWGQWDSITKVTEQLIVPGIYFPVGMESWGKILKGENILDDLKDT